MEKPKIRPPPSKNAWTDGHRNLRDWLHPEYLPRCKISLWSDEGILPLAYAKSPTESSFGYFFGFWQLATSKAVAPILTINKSKDVVACKDVPFRGPENEILHFDHIFYKKRKD